MQILACNGTVTVSVGLEIFFMSLALTLRNKKLIRRWDSERKLSLRRHRTRTAKYTTDACRTRFRHTSTRLPL